MQEQCLGVNGYCSNGQKHGEVGGRKAAEAAIYPPKLCDAMAKGVARQYEKDDAGSEESEGRHHEIAPQKIKLVVRKWNGQVEKINVSKGRCSKTYPCGAETNLTQPT